MAKKKRKKFDTSQLQMEDEALKQRIVERHRSVASKRRRKKILTLLVIVAVFALLGTMCGRDIVRLKAENRALKKQQVALEKQRDELKEELKNTDNQEYIREQARKQLRLLNPGEILFTFEDDEESKDAEDSGETEESEDSKDSKDKGSEEKTDSEGKDE